MSLVNIDCILIIKKLQHQTGQNLLKALTDVYFTQVSEALVKMNSALKSLDMETLRREAHSLKSSSATLGVTRVSDLCRSIEDELTLEKDPTQAKLQSLVDELGLAAQPSLNELKLVTLREG